MRRQLEPLAQGLGLALSGLVAILRQDDGGDVGKGAGGKADLLALSCRRGTGGGEEGMAGRTSLDLGQADCIDGAPGPINLSHLTP